jgi:hypothetical protein
MITPDCPEFAGPGQGMSLRAIGRELGVPETTIRRALKERMSSDVADGFDDSGECAKNSSDIRQIANDPRLKLTPTGCVETLS